MSGVPADISGLIADTTGEHFCECSPAAEGLHLERCLSQCSRAHKGPSIPAHSYKIYVLTFARRKDPGVNQILELLQTGTKVMN